eukprot:scaffold43600_cov36-Cyclotella_meneghiniana.AAC.6
MGHEIYLMLELPDVRFVNGESQGEAQLHNPSLTTYDCVGCSSVVYPSLIASAPIRVGHSTGFSHNSSSFSYLLNAD